MAAVVALATNAAAQQRPLVTEDPEIIGPGRLLIEAGVDFERDLHYTVSGLRGDRLAVPTFGISVGLSSIAELQFDAGFYQRLDITHRDVGAPLASLLEIEGVRTTDVEDIIVGTKFKILSETPSRPSFGLRLATKLPNASNEKGLGTDMTDFSASLLMAKTVDSIRVVANAGYAILGNPSSVVPDQHDLVTFGLSVARAMTTAAEVVAEVNGRVNPATDPTPGGENRAALRAGGRYTKGTVRVDVGVIIGLTPRDPEIGYTAGFTWVFNGFSVP